MLKRIHIKNFRSIKDIVIDDLSNVVALLGRNAVGKTNILRAIEWAARSASSTEAIRFPTTRPSELPTTVSLEMSLEKSRLRYSVLLDNARGDRKKTSSGAEIILKESIYIGTEKKKWLKLISRNRATAQIVHPGVSHHINDIRRSASKNMLQIMPALPCLPLILAQLPPNHSLAKTLRPFISFLNAIRYYALDEPTNPLTEANLYSHEMEYSNWWMQYKTTGNAGDSVTMRILNMALDHPDKLAELEELLGPRGLGIIDKIEFKRVIDDKGVLRSSEKVRDFEGSARTFYNLTFHPSGGCGASGAQFGFHDLSSGTRRIVRILTCMLFDRSSVMLIEHPEEGIHRTLLIKLINIFLSYADPTQFVLSSHSPVVFDSLSPDLVRLVTMTEGMTQLRPLSAREISAAEDYMSEEGALSDFLEIVQSE